MSNSTKSNSSEESILLFRGKHSFVVNQTDRDDTLSTGEEAWTEEAETLAITWADRAGDKSKIHQIAAGKNAKLHIVFGLPGVLLPVIFAVAAPSLEDVQGGAYVLMGSYIVMAIVNGINSFFNFDKRKSDNENFSARFGELTSEVRYQLFKSRRFRVPSDEFLARLQTKLNSLVEQEPPT